MNTNDDARAARTPGPFVRHPTKRTLIGVSEHGAFGPIAFVVPRPGQTEGNARLLEASDAMFEACRLALPLIEQEADAREFSGEAGSDHVWRTVATALRSALRKATKGDS